MTYGRSLWYFFHDSAQWYNILAPLLMAAHWMNIINSEHGKSIIFFVFTPSVLAPHAALMLTYLLFYCILFVYLNF